MAEEAEALAARLTSTVSTPMGFSGTTINSLRVRNSYLEMTFGAGVSPVLSDEFCLYASLYREGLHSNSGFYKVIESILARRIRLDWQKKQSGQELQEMYLHFLKSLLEVSLLDFS